MSFSYLRENDKPINIPDGMVFRNSTTNMDIPSTFIKDEEYYFVTWMYSYELINNIENEKDKDKFESWETALNPERFNLLSILNFRRTKDDFTFNKCVEHTLISKFVSHVAITNRKWGKVASALSKDEISKQAQWESVKSFWNKVELEQIEENTKLSEKKLDQIETRQQVQATENASNQINVIQNRFINRSKKRGHDLQVDEETSKRCKTESENRTRSGRTVVPNYSHFYGESIINEDCDAPENSSQGSSNSDELNDELVTQENQENDHFDENQDIQNDDQKYLTLAYTSSDGIKIKKPNRLNLISSDDSSQETDDEDIPPEDSFLSASNGPKIWILPSGQNVGDIYANKISENARTTKKRKKLTAIKKAILRYGASNIIDLSAHMKKWFCIDDRKFIIKDYESMLRIPEMATEESSFVLKIEDVWSEDQVNILDVTPESTHTEIDVILKACAYIVEGLSKNLKVYSIWGESFCPLSRSTDYTKGRKCDVRFISALGVDVGEWEFSAKAIANKTIGDRCRSARINQSILNGLLEYNLNYEQAKSILIPFLQFGGTNGQLLVEDLVEGFYIVLPGPKFELPIRLRDIGKLKTAINVIKLVMDMYEKTCETIENLETFHHDFDDIFEEDYHVDKPTHFKYKYIRKSWWTPKNSLF
ncbi:1140_t:CDS:10 [Diversispora eburnea]|uniref:1140_t:CDS:1 n=1 Tax=Diversispora eburnea TaxID=1213867 RepID=A0A9N9C8U4_9GLOM|nr:1140_t:CDS:10 [Diversispora eburnea]